MKRKCSLLLAFLLVFSGIHFNAFIAHADWDFTVYFDADEGSPQPAVQELVREAIVKSPVEPKKEGYLFVGWQETHNSKFIDLSKRVWVIGNELIAYTDTDGEEHSNVDIRNGLQLKAIYAKKGPLKVVFNTDGGSSAPSSQTVNDGEKIQKPADPVKEGYDFQYWTSKIVTDKFGNYYQLDFDTAVTASYHSGTESVYNGVNFITTNGGYVNYNAQSSETLELIAIYKEAEVIPEPKYYQVSFNTDGGSPEPATQTVEEGNAPAVPSEVPTKDGFVFSYWGFEDGTRTPDFSLIQVNEDMTFKAVYEKVEPDIRYYKVSFDVNGGSPTPATQTVAEGMAPAVPTTPEKSGYSFKYWSLDGEMTPDFSLIRVMEDLTFKAIYEKVEPDTRYYKVNFDANGGSPTPAMQTVAEGMAPTMPNPAPTKSGYVFDYWAFEDGTRTPAFSLIQVNEDVTFKAVYKKVAPDTRYYKVSFDANGGSPTPATQTVAEGMAPTMPNPAPTKSGYTFDYWAFEDGERTPNFSLIPINEDVTFKAVYKKVEPATKYYKVSFDANGGSPTPASQTVAEGMAPTMPNPAPTKSGYTFDYWAFEDGTRTPAFSLIQVNEDITLKAIYDKEKQDSNDDDKDKDKDKDDVKTVKVVFDTVGGKPKPNTQYVEIGHKATEPSTDPKKDDVEFIGWYTAKGEYDFDKAVERDMILYAKYKNNNHKQRRQDIIIDDDDYDKAIIQYAEPFFKGYPDNTFKPEDSISRAEMATVFARILEIDLSKLDVKMQFSDTKGHWAEKYILAAADYGLLNGYPDGSFRPDDKMKRAEIAAIINKYWDIQGFVPEYADANVTDIESHWAKRLILALYNHRFVDLYQDNSFKPDAALKRAEVAQILNRITDRPLISLTSELYKDVPKSHWAFDEVNTASSKAKK